MWSGDHAPIIAHAWGGVSYSTPLAACTHRPAVEGDIAHLREQVVPCVAENQTHEFRSHSPASWLAGMGRAWKGSQCDV